MITTRRSILGAGVALMLAAGLTAGLTGCSAGQSSLIPTAGAAAAKSPAATPAAAVTPALATGDIVDAAQVDFILKAGRGQRAYPMADGTFVVVTKTEPVPAAVQADANAKAAAVVAAYRDDTTDHAAAQRSFQSTEGAIASGTGKRVIFVAGQIGYATNMAETKTYFLTVRGVASSLGTLYSNHAEAQAAIDAFLAGVEIPAEWMVVWAE